MKVKEMDRKNVSVHLDTYSRLQQYGNLGDSYSDVIDNIIDFAESKGLTRDKLLQLKKDRYTAAHKA